VAGFAGTLLRYWLSGAVAKRYGETFPYGTLAVNASGLHTANIWNPDRVYVLSGKQTGIPI